MLVGMTLLEDSPSILRRDTSVTCEGFVRILLRGAQAQPRWYRDIESCKMIDYMLVLDVTLSWASFLLLIFGGYHD